MGSTERSDRQDSANLDVPMSSSFLPNLCSVENPVAVIDRNAERHHVRDIAEPFIAFLYSEDAQRAFAESHFPRQIRLWHKPSPRHSCTRLPFLLSPNWEDGTTSLPYCSAGKEVGPER